MVKLIDMDSMDVPRSSDIWLLDVDESQKGYVASIHIILGQGYGKEAVRLILDEMRKGGRFSKATVCYVEGNDASRALFGGFGFVETSHQWDEITIELNLSLCTR